MKLVVTGGAGFIGSHIAALALEQGHQVVCVDDLSRGHRENVPPGARLEVLDVGSPELRELLSAEAPDVVDHHAAQIDVRRAVEDPVFDARQNVLGFLNVLEGCRHAGVRRVVFASSGGAIYGEQDVHPAPETHATRPLSPYGITKLTGEKYLDFYRKVHGMETVALRYANVYGPRQDAGGDAGVVAIFCSALLAGRTATIFGDGRATRDYVYVEDVARANMAALAPGVSPGPFNIGTGRETSVNELYAMIRSAARSELAPVHQPARAGEVSRSCIDARLAKLDLGWEPAVRLEEGVAATLAWFRDQETRKAPGA